jgi:hypothetical protein
MCKSKKKENDSISLDRFKATVKKHQFVSPSRGAAAPSRKCDEGEKFNIQ